MLFFVLVNKNSLNQGNKAGGQDGRFILTGPAHALWQMRLPWSVSVLHAGIAPADALRHRRCRSLPGDPFSYS